MAEKTFRVWGNIFGSSKFELDNNFSVSWDIQHVLSTKFGSNVCGIDSSNISINYIPVLVGI